MLCWVAYPALVRRHGSYKVPVWQVVWKDSRELGVAVARSRTGQVFVVANYSPPGNFVGCFAENVPPVG